MCLLKCKLYFLSVQFNVFSLEKMLFSAKCYFELNVFIYVVVADEMHFHKTFFLIYTILSDGLTELFIKRNLLCKLMKDLFKKLTMLLTNMDKKCMET